MTGADAVPESTGGFARRPPGGCCYYGCERLDAWRHTNSAAHAVGEVRPGAVSDNFGGVVGEGGPREGAGGGGLWLPLFAPPRFVRIRSPGGPGFPAGVDPNSTKWWLLSSYEIPNWRGIRDLSQPPGTGPPAYVVLDQLGTEEACTR